MLHDAGRLPFGVQVEDLLLGFAARYFYFAVTIAARMVAELASCTAYPSYGADLRRLRASTLTIQKANINMTALTDYSRRHD